MPGLNTPAKNGIGQKSKSKLTKCNSFNRHGPDFTNIVEPCEKCVFVDLAICAIGFASSGRNRLFGEMNLLKPLYFVKIDSEICQNDIVGLVLPSVEARLDQAR